MLTLKRLVACKLPVLGDLNASVCRSDTEDESIDTSNGTSPTSDVGSDAIMTGRDLMLRHLQRFNK